MAKILTTKDLAEELGTDTRRLRRFLRSKRSPVSRVGKGNRYLIDPQQLRQLRTRFSRWSTEYAQR
jgi:predicted transcriptional regulator of viral defense system